jgi:hypothetical protein
MATYQYWSSGAVSGSAGYLSCDNLTITDTITLGSEFATLMRAKIYLAGNGVDSYLVQSASFQQDVHRSPITVNNATTFYVPAYGRWSDYSSLVGFTIPGTVDAVMECKLKVPILIPIIGGGGDVPIDPTPSGSPSPGVISYIDDGTTGIESGKTLLCLNFEGADGATTWTEEAQGLVPSESYGSELDTATLLSPISSDGALVYLSPLDISNDFTFHGWVRINGIAAATADTYYYLIIGTEPEGAFLFFQWAGGASNNVYMTLYAKNDTMIFDGVVMNNPFSDQVWTHIAFVQRGQNTIFFIDGQVVRIWTSAIVDPFGQGHHLTGPNNFTLYTHSHTATKFNFDAFELVNYAKWITNFTPPTSAPPIDTPVDTTSVTSTETITVTDNSLIQAGDTITITGTSA